MNMKKKMKRVCTSRQTKVCPTVMLTRLTLLLLYIVRLMHLHAHFFQSIVFLSIHVRCCHSHCWWFFFLSLSSCTTLFKHFHLLQNHHHSACGCPLMQSEYKNNINSIGKSIIAFPFKKALLAHITTQWDILNKVNFQALECRCHTRWKITSNKAIVHKNRRRTQGRGNCGKVNLQSDESDAAHDI